jgi:hypothetical protein
MLLGLLLDISGTLVELHPPSDPAAMAEVVMLNIELNGAHDNGHYELHLDGLTVGLEFQWQAGAFGEDAIVVTPPEGVFCEPVDCRIVVPEGQRGTVLLFDFVGY